MGTFSARLDPISLIRLLNPDLSASRAYFGDLLIVMFWLNWNLMTLHAYYYYGDWPGG